jgi:hypothetical protein
MKAREINSTIRYTMWSVFKERVSWTTRRSRPQIQR